MQTTGEWLRATRERQTREDGEPWSQDDFLDALEADTGWHLHRPNYSKYETGKATPKRDTLARLVGFWAGRGEPGPDLTPPVEPAPAPDLAQAIVMLTQELTALRLERTELSGKVERLSATVDRLVEESLAHASRPAREAHAAPPATAG